MKVKRPLKGPGVIVAALMTALASCSKPIDHCKVMIVTLEKSVKPDVLRQATGDLVAKYPTGAAHRLSTDEMPDAVRNVMNSLGFAEAVVCEDVISGQRLLCMDSPGGFASFGVKVAPPGVYLAPSTNTHGLTELRWKDGIHVFYFVQ